MSLSLLPMPPGDPDSLESYAATLVAAADRMGSLASNTVQVTSAVRSGAGWTGSAADGYSAFTGSLASSTASTAPQLEQIASAVKGYAECLRIAQQKVSAYNQAVEAASCLSPAKQASELNALEAEREGAVMAISGADTVGDGAASAISGLLTIQSASLQNQIQLLNEETRALTAPVGPEAEPLSPGSQQRAAALARLRAFLNGSNLPPDPHAEGASGTGYENPYTDLNGSPSVGDAGDG